REQDLDLPRPCGVLLAVHPCPRRAGAEGPAAPAPRGSAARARRHPCAGPVPRSASPAPGAVSTSTGRFGFTGMASVTALGLGPRGHARAAAFAAGHGSEGAVRLAAL